MIVIRDGYCGLAPVPGGRLNVGIVLGKTWRPLLRKAGAASVARSIVADVGGPLSTAICDSIEGAVPLGHRVTRRAGRDWLLVGDAAGFLDPFSGEGLHRALVSARLAASAIDRSLSGQTTALAAYDRAMRARFTAKDAVSWLVQAFLGRPELFEYAARRLATRPTIRNELGLVMGDLIPARRGFDPRFLARLLAP
jgi:flavin-dependent dehydrogenase